MKKKLDWLKNWQLLKNLQFLSYQADIQATLPTHEPIIWGKFHKDWKEIVDFFSNSEILNQSNFFASVSRLDITPCSSQLQAHSGLPWKLFLIISNLLFSSYGLKSNAFQVILNHLNWFKVPVITYGCIKIYLKHCSGEKAVKIGSTF